jgi:hypothetical protein
MRDADRVKTRIQALHGNPLDDLENSLRSSFGIRAESGERSEPVEA